MGRIVIAFICTSFAWVSQITAGAPFSKVSAEPVSCIRYTGLFIGIGDYADLPDRADATASAKAMYELFRSAPGHERNVLLLDDQASHSAVNQALQELHALGRDECAVLYFAGHAATWDAELDGQVGFLLLAGSRKDHSPPDAALSMRYIRQVVETSMAAGVLILLDSGIGGLAGDALRTTDDTTATRSRLVLTAGGRDADVSSNGGISPFARALIAGLSGRATAAGAPIEIDTASRLAAFVERAMASSEIPLQYPSFRTLVEDGGDMMLPELPSQDRIRIDLDEIEAGERPQAHVVVRAEPESATILIDGVPIGRGSISTNVPAGEATIEAAMAGHATWRLRVHLRPGEERTFTARPALSEAYLQVLNLPEGAAVRLDGHDISPADVVHHVQPGPLRLEVSIPNRKPMVVDFHVQAGEHGLVSYRDEAFSWGVPLRSMIVPGWGQFHAGAYGQAILTGVVVGSLAGLGVAADRRYDLREEAYHNTVLAYRRAQTSAAVEGAKVDLVAAFEEAQDASQLRRITWSAFAVAYSANFFDALLRHARGPKLVVSGGPTSVIINPLVDASSEGTAFGVKIRF